MLIDVYMYTYIHPYSLYASACISMPLRLQPYIPTYTFIYYMIDHEYTLYLILYSYHTIPSHPLGMPSHSTASCIGYLPFLPPFLLPFLPAAPPPRRLSASNSGSGSDTSTKNSVTLERGRYVDI